MLDFGAVARLPKGLPEPVGRLTRLALEGDADGVMEGLRAEGFVPDSAHVDAEGILAYLRPMLEPLAVEEFQFSREWLRSEARRIGDPRSPAYALGRQLNLPPSYLLIHRVTLGSIGVLCQLNARARSLPLDRGALAARVRRPETHQVTHHHSVSSLASMFRRLTRTHASHSHPNSVS